MSTLSTLSTVTASPLSVPQASAALATARATDPQAATVSLTRRGRLVISLLVLLILGALLVVTAGRSEAGDPASVGRTTQVVVQPGQTLWQVAAAAMPGVDPREAVEQVRELNALTTSMVRPGQALTVPASA